jgi:hypothetical protein
MPFFYELTHLVDVGSWWVRVRGLDYNKEDEEGEGDWYHHSRDHD